GVSARKPNGSEVDIAAGSSAELAKIVNRVATQSADQFLNAAAVGGLFSANGEAVGESLVLATDRNRPHHQPGSRVDRTHVATEQISFLHRQKRRKDSRQRAAIFDGRFSELFVNQRGNVVPFQVGDFLTILCRWLR